MDEVPDTRPSLLVRLCDPRDERAWTEFTAIYSPLIYRLACRKGFQDADAEDLVQEVLRAVASAMDRWDPDPCKGPFRNWLFRIARNMMLNLVTSQRRHPPGTGSEKIQWLLEAQPSPSPADSALFETEYKRQLFRWAAERVSGEFRASTWAAFWETGVEGKKAQAVADALGISIGAVYMARSRVVARIRQVIEQVEGEWPGRE
jgi:RNA polymerase sigma factor (sigma-70 family)